LSNLEEERVAGVWWGDQTLLASVQIIFSNSPLSKDRGTISLRKAISLR